MTTIMLDFHSDGIFSSSITLNYIFSLVPLLVLFCHILIVHSRSSVISHIDCYVSVFWHTDCVFLTYAFSKFLSFTGFFTALNSFQTLFFLPWKSYSMSVVIFF